MPKALVAVTNDIVTDRRILKTSEALESLGYKVLIFGRLRKNSLSTQQIPFHTIRKKLYFNTKAFFYAEYNIRLFFHLIFNRYQLIIANDLDTLVACLLASKILNIKLIYDSHEYFCYTPELVNRKLVQQIWLKIEQLTIPKIKTCITVNKSIAELYNKQYNQSFHVIRNIPNLKSLPKKKNKSEVNIPENHKVIILQGAGININRGAEELIEAMQFVNNATLLIIGSGDVIEQLPTLIEKLALKNKVKLLPKMNYSELLSYTQLADIGVSIDKPNNENYRNSLPNKLFDYMHCGCAILGSEVKEVKNIIENYQIGKIINNHHPLTIAESINEMLYNEDKLNEMKNNTKVAIRDFDGIAEQQKLTQIIASA
jgi:glycosyltransferase involved in cell wall biosynthesis